MDFKPNGKLAEIPQGVDALACGIHHNSDSDHRCTDNAKSVTEVTRRAHRAMLRHENTILSGSEVVVPSVQCKNDGGCQGEKEKEETEETMRHSGMGVRCEG